MRKLLFVFLLLALIPLGPVSAEADTGLHGQILIPALNFEADMGWSWNYPDFWGGWRDCTFWPVYGTIGCHAPERNALYRARPGMILTMKGIYTWTEQQYIIVDVEIVDADHRFQPPPPNEIYIIICYPDRPWPQRLVIHLVELDHAPFYNRVADHWREL